MSRCKVCRGSGACVACDGTGIDYAQELEDTPDYPGCLECEGTGECVNCDGTGDDFED